METPLSILLNDKGYTIHSVASTSSVLDCALKMNQLGIGALLVIDKGKLQGIISERDIIRKMIVCQCDPSTTEVVAIMTKELVTVSPATSVREAMRLVTEKRFRHLPVLENGKLIGVISIGDLTRWAMLSQANEINALTGYISGENR